MSEGFNGKCLCGAVSYQSAVAPETLMKCHCRDCQYISGGEASVLVALPKDMCKVSGATKAYTTKSAAGRKVTRKFCPECGTHILSEAEAQPDNLFIKAGTMDKDASSKLKTAAVLWTDNANPWTHIDEDAMAFETQPG